MSRALASLIALAAGAGGAVAGDVSYVGLATASGGMRTEMDVSGLGALLAIRHHPDDQVIAAEWDGDAIGSSDGEIYVTSALYAGMRGARTPLPHLATTEAVEVARGPDRLVTAFRMGEIEVELEQEMVVQGAGGVVTGHVLRQIYRMTNAGESPVALDMLRFADVDLAYDDTARDAGGVLSGPTGAIAFQTDAAFVAPATPALFVGIASDVSGSRGAGRAQRHEVGGFREILDGVETGRDLSMRVEGDLDGDGITDGRRDLAMALQDRLALGPGESASYVAETLVGRPAASGGPAALCAVALMEGAPEDGLLWPFLDGSGGGVGAMALGGGAAGGALSPRADTAATSVSYRPGRGGRAPVWGGPAPRAVPPSLPTAPVADLPVLPSLPPVPFWPSAEEPRDGAPDAPVTGGPKRPVPDPVFDPVVPAGTPVVPPAEWPVMPGGPVVTVDGPPVAPRPKAPLPVPLPAAGWLMLGALGALGGLSRGSAARRRRS